MPQASLIPELEDVARQASPERLAIVLERVATLFLNSAEQYGDDHIALFDDVLSCLVVEIETKARAELARRFAPVPNAPINVVRHLSRDDDIDVAGPLLSQSVQLGDEDLLAVARTKGQAHLRAIADRSGIDERLTDVLVERGDRDVIRQLAENRDARFSDNGFSVLVRRSGDDDALAEAVGSRPDIPARLFRMLLLQATGVVQQRLLEAANPQLQSEIRGILAQVSNEVGARAQPAYTAAQKTVDDLLQSGQLDEAALAKFAGSGKFETTVVGLSVLSDVPVDVVDRLLGGERPDPILILCKAAGWSWDTARTIMSVRPKARGAPSRGLDTAYANFERLSPATAQRILRFWQARPVGSDVA